MASNFAAMSERIEGYFHYLFVIELDYLVQRAKHFGKNALHEDLKTIAEIVEGVLESIQDVDFPPDNRIYWVAGLALAKMRELAEGECLDNCEKCCLSEDLAQSIKLGRL